MCLIRLTSRARLLAVALLLSATGANAEMKPLWELGIGVGGFTFPDYRGSNEQSSYAFPTPYAVYRSDIFKADRDGVRSILFDSDRVELNISLSASLPVDSKKNTARRGMPDLEPTVEIGPSMDITLWRSTDRASKLDLRLPLRMAFTIESSPENAGLIFSPRLNLDVEDPLGFSDWNLGILAGPIFTDRRNNAYFYDVKSAYATADRPAYRADGGYAGTQFLVALSKRFPDFWVGSFVRYDTLNGAVFDDSPLMRSDSAWSAGFAIAWIFAESSQKVEADY